MTNDIPQSINMSVFIVLFFKNLVPNIHRNCRNSYISEFLAILLGYVHDTLAKIVAKDYEDPTPERRSDKCDRDKWEHLHPKNTSRNRDQMAHNRNESSQKSIHICILQKEIFSSLVFLRCDEDIFSIFCEKWSTEPLAENEIIE